MYDLIKNKRKFLGAGSKNRADLFHKNSYRPKAGKKAKLKILKIIMRIQDSKILRK